MTTQQLELGEFVVPEVTGLSLQARYDAFHQANPWVLAALERLTEDWLRNTGRRLGIAALFEQLRWQHGLATQGDPFRLNNNHRAFYARALIELHPEWSDVFETRQQKAA